MGIFYEFKFLKKNNLKNNLIIIGSYKVFILISVKLLGILVISHYFISLLLMNNIQQT